MGWSSQLTSNFIIIARILQAVSVLMGVGLVLSALYQLKKYGESRTMMSSQHSIAGPILMLLGGGFLLALPTFADTALFAFWGHYNPLRYRSALADYNSMLPPVLVFVRVIGLGSFMRGIVLLARSGGERSQQGTLSKALIHIIGGILCIHILGTIHLLELTLGVA